LGAAAAVLPFAGRTTFNSSVSSPLSETKGLTVDEEEEEEDEEEALRFFALLAAATAASAAALIFASPSSFRRRQNKVEGDLPSGENSIIWRLLYATFTRTLSWGFSRQSLGILEAAKSSSKSYSPTSSGKSPP
jgi:hypothetical protein